MSMFTEDWNASQFWYNEETANFLAKALCEGAAGKRIAILSAPSAFVACRNYLVSFLLCLGVRKKSLT